MTDEYGKAAFDHVAELQAQLADLEAQLVALALAGVGLAVILMLLSWKLWHQ